MGRKIFVSYKYSDSKVKSLPSAFFNTTARDYVDKLQELLAEDDHIYKGENDNESLAGFKDSTIESKLRQKIFDSSTTIVFVSKGMKELLKPETNQWMPWEIAYSLKVMTRGEKVSGTNAVLAVVLPDEYGNYDYYIVDNSCPYCNCRTLKTDFLFQILRDNMFNIKNPVFSNCENHINNKPYLGHSSYIYSVKWEDFENNINKYIEIANSIKDNLDDYDICKTVK